MSPMKLVLALAMAFAVIGGCGGPSAKEVRSARTAEYFAPPKHLLDLALQVTQFDYKIGAIDIDGLKFETKPQWYTQNGGRLSANEDLNGEYVNAGANRPSAPQADGSLRRSDGSDFLVSLIVKVRLIGTDRAMVEVIPRTWQMIPASPQPRELKPDDPYLPGWVQGRVDALSVAIYDQAKKRYLPPGG